MHTLIIQVTNANGEQHKTRRTAFSWLVCYAFQMAGEPLMNEEYSVQKISQLVLLSHYNDFIIAHIFPVSS